MVAVAIICSTGLCGILFTGLLLSRGLHSIINRCVCVCVCYFFIKLVPSLLLSISFG